MKEIIDLLLLVMLFYFGWKALKRLFLPFTSQSPQNRRTTNSQQRSASPQDVQRNQAKEKELNWDAETVDFEEIKDDDTSSK